MVEFDANLNPIEPSGPINFNQSPTSPTPSTPTTPPPVFTQPTPKPPTNNYLVKRLVDLVTLVVIVGVVIGAINMFGNRVSNPTQPEGLNVSADATVYATPDIAKVTVGVNKLANTVANVEKQVTDISQKIKDTLTTLGIEDKDIKTTNYNLYPEQSYRSNGTSTVTGYRAQHSYQITIRDLNITTDVVAAATKAGANEVGQVVFTLENPDSKLAEARKEAMSKAKDKAKQMAEDGGFRIGRLMSVNEYNDNPIPLYDGMGGGEKVVAPTPEPGNFSIKVTVNLTYQIR